MLSACLQHVHYLTVLPALRPSPHPNTSEASSDFMPARPSSSRDPSTAPHCSHPPATAAPAAASTSSLQSAGRGLKAVPLSPSAKEVDRSYFDSYGGFGIHQDMISDKVSVPLVLKSSRIFPLAPFNDPSPAMNTSPCLPPALLSHARFLRSARLAAAHRRLPARARGQPLPGQGEGRA